MFNHVRSRHRDYRQVSTLSAHPPPQTIQNSMDAFVSRKRRRISGLEVIQAPTPLVPKEAAAKEACALNDDDEDTDLKLALLASLHPKIDQQTLLEALLVSQGSVDYASEALAPRLSKPATLRKTSGSIYQSSLASCGIASIQEVGVKKILAKKGRPLHLYLPEDVEAHTPCSLILNFLPREEADALLLELLHESSTYRKLEFQLFDRVVESPHTFGFYVNSLAEAEAQKTEYIYDGKKVEDVRQSLPEMLHALDKVEETVNLEIQRRIRDFYPDGKKLNHQSPGLWKPNTVRLRMHCAKVEMPY
jgi:hypothetical protein